MKRIFIFTLSFLLFFSCKKEQPELRSLEEDCGCAQDVSANFKMGEYTDDLFKTQFIETDTIHFYRLYAAGNVSNFSFLPAKVTFIADLENADSYEWHVGNNASIQTTRSFTLTFDDTLGVIPVTLIVNAKANKICRPNDDGVDTITKYLKLTSFPDFPLKGQYKGFRSDQPHTEYIVEIDTFTDILTSGTVLYGIKNLVQELDNFLPLTSDYKTFSFGGINNMASFSQDPHYSIYPYNGIGQQHIPLVFDRKTKTLIIKYSYYWKEDLSDGPTHYYEKITFTGKKL